MAVAHESLTARKPCPPHLFLRMDRRHVHYNRRWAAVGGRTGGCRPKAETRGRIQAPGLLSTGPGGQRDDYDAGYRRLDSKCNFSGTLRGAGEVKSLASTFLRRLWGGLSFGMRTELICTRTVSIVRDAGCRCLGSLRNFSGILRGSGMVRKLGILISTLGWIFVQKEKKAHLLSAMSQFLAAAAAVVFRACFSTWACGRGGGVQCLGQPARRQAPCWG